MNIWKQLTSCTYASFITFQPVPPKLTIVNALATILLPCEGTLPLTGFSSSSDTLYTFGFATFDPSTRQPLPPKNDMIEQFCIYGLKLTIGLLGANPTYDPLFTV